MRLLEVRATRCVRHRFSADALATRAPALQGVLFEPDAMKHAAVATLLGDRREPRGRQRARGGRGASIAPRSGRAQPLVRAPDAAGQLPGERLHPRAPLGKGCVRPCGLFHVHMRGTGGKFYGENLAESLVPPRRVLLDHRRLVAGRCQRASVAAMPPGSLRTVILRHPIERILSRYWMEGRWDLFKRASAEKRDVPLEQWIRFTKARNSGTRLWQMPQEYYLKTLVGWQGKPFCDDAARSAGCANGLGRAQFERARALDQARPVVGSRERVRLSAPPQVEALARRSASRRTGTAAGSRSTASSSRASESRAPRAGTRARGRAGGRQTRPTLESPGFGETTRTTSSCTSGRHAVCTIGWRPKGPWPRASFPCSPPVSSARAFRAWPIRCRDEPAASAGCARGSVRGTGEVLWRLRTTSSARAPALWTRALSPPCGLRTYLRHTEMEGRFSQTYLP